MSFSVLLLLVHARVPNSPDAAVRVGQGPLTSSCAVHFATKQDEKFIRPKRLICGALRRFADKNSGSKNQRWVFERKKTTKSGKAERWRGLVFARFFEPEFRQSFTRRKFFWFFSFKEKNTGRQKIKLIHYQMAAEFVLSFRKQRVI